MARAQIVALELSKLDLLIVLCARDATQNGVGFANTDLGQTILLFIISLDAQDF